MATRTILGGVVAGVLVFFWGWASHMVLGLGDIGIKMIPNEEVVLRAVRDSIKDPGLYFFPGMDRAAAMTPEAKKAAEERWMEAYKKGPHGILVYQPEGEVPMSPRQLGTQFAVDLLAGLVAALILALGAGRLPGFGARLVSVTLLGLFAGIVNNLPYWIWYGFPTDFTLAQIADHVLGWFIGGLALAAIVRRPPGVPVVQLA